MVTGAFSIFLTRSDPGRPPKGEAVKICEIPITESLLRLYHGHGSLATSSDSSSVTYQESPTAKERRIFYAYSSPFIRDLQCEQEKVVLIGHYETQYQIELEWINDELIEKPIKFYKYCLQTEEYKNRITDWGIPTSKICN